MIILLNGHSLTAKDRFRAEKFAMNLSERQSSATITIGPEAPVISTGDWLQDEYEPGAGIVWRVKSVDTDYAANTRTLNCEHVINCLKDLIVFGEVKPGTMAGNSGASVCTAVQAARYVLNRQSDWALGTFGYNKSAPYNFNSDDLFECLETISSSLLTPFWTYDFSRYPFLLNITQPSDAVQCEMRTDRNIRTLKKTIDRTRMYTRFYPIGKDNKHLPGNGYVSRNENLYGVVCNVETDNEMDTDAKLQAWAEEKLQNHAEPLVTVTISGLELSEATGEPLDRLVLGTVCRVPLPEYGTTIQERITKLSWSDKVADPESVTVTLANQVEDVASIVNKLNKSSKKKSKSHAKQGEADHAWMVDTNDHIGLVAEAVAGEGASKDWSRVASVMVDGQGLHQKVTKAQGDIVTQQAQIDVNENLILQEVMDRTRADTTLNGRITVEAGKISQVVEAVGKDGKVTAASIVLAINESSGESEAKIDAQRVYIGTQKSTTVIAGKCSLSDVTADYIQGRIATLSVLRAAAISASGNIYTTNGYMMAPYIYIGTSGNARTISGSIWALRITQSGNTYTLQKQDYDDTAWVDVGSFSRATSLSAAWDGNRKFTASASPQGVTRYTTLRSSVPQDHQQWTGLHGVLTIQATIDDSEYFVDCGTIEVDAPTQPPTPTTLSGAWQSSPAGELLVTASPQGSQIRFQLMDTVPADISWNNNVATVTVYANLNGGETKYDTYKRLTVDATSVFNAGKQAATVGCSWSGGTFTAYNSSNASNKATTEIASQYDISWNNNVATVGLKAFTNGSEQAALIGRDLTIDASGIFNAGKQAATLNSSWSGGTFTAYNASNASHSAYTTIASQYDISWSGTTGTVTLKAFTNGSEQAAEIGRTLSIDASTVYNSGKHDATVSCNWASGTFTAYNANNASNKAVTTIASQADVTWNDKVATVKLKAFTNGSEQAALIGRELSITAPFTKYTFVKAFDRNDQVYKGPLYDASGHCLVSGSYYWYGYSQNFSTTARAELWRHN